MAFILQTIIGVQLYSILLGLLLLFDVAFSTRDNKYCHWCAFANFTAIQQNVMQLAIDLGGSCALADLRCFSNGNQSGSYGKFCFRSTA